MPPVSYPQQPPRAEPLQSAAGRPVRRVLRWAGILFGKVCLILLAFCIPAACAGLYWLRTPEAERRVLNEATRLLAEQGLIFEAAHLSGPLPWRITCSELSFADSEGIVGKAARAELRWNPFALLLGTVSIEALEIDEPALFRLPSPSQSRPEAAPPDTAAFFPLPLTIRVAAFSIREGRLRKELLQPEARGERDTPALGFSLSGAALLDSDGLTGTVRADVRLSKGDGFSMDAQLEHGRNVPDAGGAQDRLTIDIAGTENPGGVLAWLLNRRDIPAFRLRVKGTGGLKDWRGALFVSAGQSGESAVGIDAPAFVADLRLRCPNGSLWKDLLLSPNIAARLTAEANLKGCLPSFLIPVIGEKAMLDASLTATGEEYHLTAKAHNGLWRLSLPDVVIRGEQISMPRLEFHGSGIRAEAAAGLSSGSGIVWGEANIAAEENGEWQALAARAAGLGAFSGSARVALKAVGRMDSPLVLLKADSPALTFPRGGFRNLSLSLIARSALTEEAPFAESRETERLPAQSRYMPRDARAGKNGLTALDGALAFMATEDGGGELSLSGIWRIGLPEEGREVRLSRVGARFRGLGVSFDASLAGRVPTEIGLLADSGAAPDDPFPPISLTGEINAGVDDWKSLAGMIGVPLSGSPAGARLSLENTDGVQSAALDFRLQSLSAKEPGSGRTIFSLEKLSASCIVPRLPQNGARIFLAPDFRLSLGQGMAGPLRWSAADASLTGGNGIGAFAVSMLRHKAGGAGKGKRRARGAEAREILGIRGNYDLKRREAVISTLALRSPFAGRGAGRSEQAVGLRLRKKLTLTFADGPRFSDLDITLQPGGRLTAAASLAPGDMRLKAELRDLPFSFFSLFTDAPLPRGSLRILADARSTGQGPRGNILLHSRVYPAGDRNGVIRNTAGTREADGSIASSSSGALELRLNAHLADSPGQDSALRPRDGLIWLNGAGTFGGAASRDSSGEGQLRFHIPLRPTSGGFPLPDSRAPMAASMRWKGAVAPLWRLLSLPDRSLSGTGMLHLAVTGSLEQAHPSLNAYLSQGRYQDSVEGVLLTGITLDVKSAPDGQVNAILAANDGREGALSLEASVRGLTGKTSPAISLRGHMENLRPLHRDNLFLDLSGVFGVNGSADAPNISADIRINQGECILSPSLGSSVTTLDISREIFPDAADGKTGKTASPPPPSAPGPSLNARITVPRHFFIRGMGLDSEWAGNLLISGKASQPSLIGSLRPVRGRLDILSKTFELSGGDISFTGGAAINPLLNLELTREGGGLTAVARATGSAKQPRLLLESRPPRPQDEILAQVLFGKKTLELSRFEAIQLAVALRELGGANGSTFNVLTGIRKSVGLDVLRFGSQKYKEQRASSGGSGENALKEQPGTPADADAVPSLEAGTYIKDNVYVGVEQGLDSESTAVRVEVELFPNMTLQGRSSGRTAEIGIGWKKDY
ncbi:MAG: translocation/assembly module TamB domain-containing protein [Desulfovibrio sp.]|nr:translocation/assembly module TamB domain-containing protein [Desulfovibrio sp.]